MNASGSELANNSSRGLVYAVRGESFYGLVLRAKGDRRFDVENVATGSVVNCRLKGSMRRKEFVKAEDWVLVSMRDYESDTEHHQRRGEIILKYTGPQVRQLLKAGELPDRDAYAGLRHTAGLHHMSSVCSIVDFVDDWMQEDGSSSASLQHHDVDEPHHESDEGSDEDEGDHHVDQDAARVLCERADDLPSPTFVKKSRSRRSCQQSDSVIQLDFHHAVGFQPAPVHSDPVAQTTPARVVAPRAPPAPATVTIRARVKFWDAAKGIGYATPEDKSQTKAGVDVKLTAECVEGLKKPLLRDDVVELIIDPRHDRPYVLNGGLRRVGQ